MNTMDKLARRRLPMVPAALSLNIWVAVGLLGCGKVEPPPPVAGAPAPSKAAIVPQAPVAVNDAKARDPYAFELRISLSEDAAALIVPAKESVGVLINYAGDPAPGVGDPFVDELGFIDLGQVEVDVTGKSEVVIDGGALKKDMLKYLQGEPRVNVNVFSGRQVFEDNVLDCGSFEDDLKVAVTTPVELHCKLLDWPVRRIK